MAAPQSSAGMVYASAASADAFARSLLRAYDLSDEDAATVARCLVHADLRGVDTHGLCRIPIYLDRVRKKLINVHPTLKPNRVTPVAASLDGDNGFGFVVGMRAIQEAIDMAKTYGIGVVSVKRSTHFGMAASYAMPAVEALRSWGVLYRKRRTAKRSSGERRGAASLTSRIARERGGPRDPR